MFMTLLDEDTVHLRLGEAFAANPKLDFRLLAVDQLALMSARRAS